MQNGEGDGIMVGSRRTQNWDDLRYFLALARTGTLTEAAQRVGREHTTVARRIQTLEAALDRRLFHRSHLGYALTDAGRELMQAAEVMESAFVAAGTFGQQNSRFVAGTVRIAAPDGFGSMFLASRMPRLTEHHPALETEILATARIFNLSKREADIAISLSRPRQVRLVARRLTEYRLFVYASAAYLASAPPIGNLADLRQHQFVGYIEDMLFARELNYLDEIGLGISTRLRSTNLLAQVSATIAGAGPCVLPHFIASAHQTLVSILPEQISLTRTFYMHVHEDNRQIPPIRIAAEFIADEVSRARSLFLGPN